LGPVFTGKDGCMAMPHCPGLAPAVPRLRTSLQISHQWGSAAYLVCMKGTSNAPLQ
jgi:hypothetical protein